MPTEVSWRDVTPTRFAVAPEPLGVAYALHDAAVAAYVPDGPVPMSGVEALAGGVGGRYPYIEFPPPVDWSALHGVAVANHTHACPVTDLALYWFSGNEWLLAPLEVYQDSSWHPGPLRLFRNGEWHEVATANA